MLILCAVSRIWIIPSKYRHYSFVTSLIFTVLHSVQAWLAAARGQARETQDTMTIAGRLSYGQEAVVSLCIPEGT